MTEERSGTLEQAGPIIAAGAVLWRTAADGSPKIALVHRPRYDDWSFPKGKADPGETTRHAAVREVCEETGFSCVLSRALDQASYSVPNQAGELTTKLVDYFSARVNAGSFAPNNEVDELRWLSTEQARELLSYRVDARILDSFESLPVHTATVLLVRHAKAGNRANWSGDDNLRPLSAAGQRQTAALRTILPLYGVERVYSAPRKRCTQTVAPVAADIGVDIEPEPLLSEEGYWPAPEAGVDRLLRIAAGTGTAVVSSQGGVIPDLLGRLGRAGGLSRVSGFELDEVRSRKASVWTLTFRYEQRVDNGPQPTLSLAAADYLADPLTG